MTLPKAKLFSVRLNRGGPLLAKFRNANAMSAYFGPLLLTWRMPWLEQSARQLHPDHFRK
jgi:hypothetical protein